MKSLKKLCHPCDILCDAQQRDNDLILSDLIIVRESVAKWNKKWNALLKGGFGTRQGVLRKQRTRAAGAVRERDLT